MCIRDSPSAALATAIEALEKQLSFVGWVEAGEVYRLCAERDISVSTIRRARVALGLKHSTLEISPTAKTIGISQNWKKPLWLRISQTRTSKYLSLIHI